MPASRHVPVQAPLLNEPSLTNTGPPESPIDSAPSSAVPLASKVQCSTWPPPACAVSTSLTTLVPQLWLWLSAPYQFQPLTTPLTVNGAPRSVPRPISIAVWVASLLAVYSGAYAGSASRTFQMRRSVFGSSNTAV